MMKWPQACFDYFSFHMKSLTLKLQNYWSSWNLISWCIGAASNYYSYKFSHQMSSWFCDKLRLKFWAFAWRGIHMTGKRAVYSTANDPRPQMMPRPEMIPDVNANDPAGKGRMARSFVSRIFYKFCIYIIYLCANGISLRGLMKSIS